VDERADVIATWHKYKTKAFTDLIAAGVGSARVPGVRRIITDKH